VPEHYAEADPMEEQIPHATKQWLIHGTSDEVVPAQLSRDYVTQKKGKGEDVVLVEIPNAGHFDLINPNSDAFKQVKANVLTAFT
jgi:pimeloyl-ACP methyl ester carboxylesterase